MVEKKSKYIGTSPSYENAANKTDVPRYSDRTLDVDIVLYDDLVLDGPGHLQIPRDELQHAFVLHPLADIAPAVKHPVNGRSMAELWAAFPAGHQPMQVIALAP